VTGWRLDPAERESLLRRFPPEWPDVIADHITLDAGPKAALPQETEAQIVGEINDGEGLQAMVVAIGSTTDRPDGALIVPALIVLNPETLKRSIYPCKCRL